MSFPQPVPPSWKDLGKSAFDLLAKDYPYHNKTLEVKTKTPSGVTFKVAGNKDNKSDIIHGDIEAKFNDRKNGLTFTQTWTTSNILKSVVELENTVAKGVKLDLNTIFDPKKNAKTALFGGIYKQSGVHTRAVADLLNGPVVTADAVVGRDGFLLGAESAYDVSKGNILRYAAAVGYNGPDYAVTLHGLKNLSVFHATYYHRVSPDVEAAAKAVYDPATTSESMALEVGCKAYLDSAAFVKAKINHKGAIALGYTQSLRPGVKASFGVSIDTQKLNGDVPSTNTHQVGASFVFEA